MMELVFLKLQVMNDLLHSSIQQTSSVDLEKNQLKIVEWLIFRTRISEPVHDPSTKKQTIPLSLNES